MGVFDKFKDMIGLEDYEDDELMEDDSEYMSSSYYDKPAADSGDAVPAVCSRRHTSSNVVPMQDRKVKALTNAFKLLVIEPNGFEDCSKLVDELKTRKPIIVNLEKLDPDLARKIFDFLGGATYALDGKVQKIANNIFVFAPENVDITSEGESQPYDFSSRDEDYNPWS